MDKVEDNTKYGSGDTVETENPPRPDCLDREGLARGLAKMLRCQESSTIIGLCGEWGSGKTWLIARARQILKSQAEAEPKRKAQTGNHQVPEIMEFRVWQWSGTKSLVAQFFEQLGEVIDKLQSPHCLAKLRRWVAFGSTHQRLRWYSANLAAHSEIIRGYTGGALFVTSLGAILIYGLSAKAIETCARGGWLGFTAYSIDHIQAFDDLQLHAIALLFALFVAFVASKFLAKLLASIAGADQALFDIIWSSPRAMKKLISVQLDRLSCPILVIIDDIDRLTAGEISAVFQLVKTQADFPNVRYLLAFDRDVVAKALVQVVVGTEDAGGTTGYRFLEKVVPVIVDVPAARAQDIERELLFRIGSICNEPNVGSELRWGPLWGYALCLFIRTMRDIDRFSNGLQFVWQQLGVDEFEVDVFDLVGIEALRIFEPGSYYDVARSRELLTTDYGQWERQAIIAGQSDTSQRWRDAPRMSIEALYATSSNAERVRRLFRHLFPAAGQLLRKATELEIQWDGAYPSYVDRVSDFSAFSRYFEYALGPDEWSQATVSQILAKTSDPAAFSGFCQDVMDGRDGTNRSKQGGASTYFNSKRALDLCAMIGRRLVGWIAKDVGRAQAAAESLMRAGELLPTGSNQDDGNWKFEEEMARIAHQALQTIQDRRIRSEIGMQLIYESPSWASALQVILRELTFHNGDKASGDIRDELRVFDIEDLERAKLAAIDGVLAAIHREDFWLRPQVRMYLEWCNELGCESQKIDIRQQLTKMLLNPDSAFLLLGAFLHGSANILFVRVLPSLLIEKEKDGALGLTDWVASEQLKETIPLLRGHLVKLLAQNERLLDDGARLRQTICWHQLNNHFRSKIGEEILNYDSAIAQLREEAQDTKA